MRFLPQMCLGRHKVGCHWTIEKFHPASDCVVWVVLFWVVLARMVAAVGIMLKYHLHTESLHSLLTMNT